MELPAGLAIPANFANSHLLLIAAGIGGFLLITTALGLLLRCSVHYAKFGAAAIQQSISWGCWSLVLFASLLSGPPTILIACGLISFLALREFITLAPTRKADHHTLFWAFFVILPLQYVIIGSGWYGMAAIFIPVWAFLFIAIRSTLTGDATRYLQRAATIQWGLMLCVYCLSHVPMLFLLNIPGFTDRHAELILWLILVVELGSVLQRVGSDTFGRHRIAPRLSPRHTWEGFLAGGACAAGIGCALWWLTPYSPLQALALAGGAVCLSFAGSVVMSAIKRDAGIKTMTGQGLGEKSILDRFDSLLFTAPMLFHLTRFYWT